MYCLFHLVILFSDFVLYATPKAGLPMTSLLNMTAALSYACTTTQKKTLNYLLGLECHILPSSWKAQPCSV